MSAISFIERQIACCDRGSLIVTHSNLLFDMYSLNQYTIEFFANHLFQDEVPKGKIQQLINDNTEKIDAKSYNVRENPLTYKFKLAKYGFLEKQQEIINLHPVPPSTIRDKIYYDTLNWSEDERWKLMFICSTFGSLSTRDQALIA